MKFVYLHGFASGPSSRKARFFAEKLAEHGVEFSAPDLAQGDFENLTISSQLEVLGREASGSKIRLIGSSLGGYLASLYASRHPDHVERIVLLAPAFSFAGRWTRAVGPAAMATWLSTGKLRVYHYAEGRMRDLGLAMYEDAAKWEPEPSFHQRALIFHGTLDDTVPVEASRDFAAERPNVRLIELHSGHELTDVLPQIWEESKCFLLD